ncbi:MAG: class I SAM-dependent methyltransferase [Acidobacteriia bacterium]|nr:class I SAM-dependent methyltransferase [Terriglobia bacterium]
MSLRHPPDTEALQWNDVQNSPRVLQATHELADFLPKEKNAAILDIGFGRGWFLAACLKMGYLNLSGADFGIDDKGFVKAWASEAISLYNIESNIGDFLADKPERYDFIHMSHVIEHIPKHSLLWVVDALYRALKRNGVLMLRTPNMEGPCANSSLFVTLGHEYGFCGSNLQSLLDVCGFDDIRFHESPIYRPTLKQRVGRAASWFFLQQSRIKHRLFGVNLGGQFSSELIVTARRRDVAPFFDAKYR